jgi:hypothetical protein
MHNYLTEAALFQPEPAMVVAVFPVAVAVFPVVILVVGL